MFRRQTSGSVVCASCGSLVGVNDDKCYNCGRRNPSLFGFAPALRSLGRDLGFVPFVTGMCAVVYVLMLVKGGIRMDGGPFGFLGTSGRAQFDFGAAGSTPVYTFGRWWTLLSAVWLHANILHILFNMMAVRQLAPPVAELYGPGRMVIIYTLAGVIGAFASSTFAYVFYPPTDGHMTVGASGAIFGLLGSLVYYGRRSGSRLVHGQALSWAASMFLFGFIMPGIDNVGHAGGFVGGYLAGMLLDPLKREQINHMAIAVGCLALSVLAIIVSLLLPFSHYLRSL